MKQSLQLKATQQLTLTPQLQQSIRLLQMSTLDLRTEVERFLLENPLLEHADESFIGDGTSLNGPENFSSDINEDTTNKNEQSGWGPFEWGGNSIRLRDEDYDFDRLANVPGQITLREHLLAQLGEIALPIRDHALVRLLIEELDNNGYLPISLEELAATLPSELNVDTAELAIGLALLQQFDPPGVGARSLSESLSLQLLHLPDHLPLRSLALTIVKDHLALIGNHDYTRLKKALDIDENTLKTVQQLIAGLNPRPSTAFGTDNIHYLIPDITVKKRKQQWIAILNHAVVPKLRVNQVYARLLSDNRQGDGKLVPQLREARWLVKNIQQRFDTILKVSEAIVEKQQAFFEQGELAMRPLILRDIADALGLHESTVSRVTTQKFLLCPRGVFELKYFFGNALEKHNGPTCSTTAIKAHIRKLINTENTIHPLSDSAIMRKLSDNGIQIARRTITKYREAMHIPTANQRKTL